jgi:hypothetical protein
MNRPTVNLLHQRRTQEKKRTTKISKEDADKIRERISLGESEYLLADEYGVVHGTIWFIKNNYTHVADGEGIKKANERRARKNLKIDKPQ